MLLEGTAEIFLVVELLFRFLGRKDSEWKEKSCFCEREEEIRGKTLEEGGGEGFSECIL